MCDMNAAVSVHFNINIHSLIQVLQKGKPFCTNNVNASRWLVQFLDFRWLKG